MKHYRVNGTIIAANRMPSIMEARVRLGLTGDISIKECLPPQVWYLPTDAAKVPGASQGYDPICKL